MGFSADTRRRRRQRPGAHRADRLLATAPTAASPGVNPFEQRSTARKGKKAVNAQRTPLTQPRALAEEKRRQTIGVELGERNRTNVFADRRIGEGDEELGEEDKLLARWQRETTKRRSKAAEFSLNEEEEFLTHGGRPIDQFDQDELFGSDPEAGPLGANDSDDEQLDQDITAGQHFGGGFQPVQEGAEKSHAQVMAEIIAKSKMHKADRMQEKMMLDEKTAKLDSQVIDFAALLPKAGRANPRKPLVLKDTDADYDKLVIALGTERRAAPTEPTKKPEQIAKEEKERLDILEKQRLQRMHGVQQLAQGGDELSDDFSDALDSDDEEDTQAKYLQSVRKNHGDDDHKNFSIDTPGNAAAPEKQLRDDDSIPFSFKSCPASYQQLLAVFKDLSSPQRAIVLGRLHKCFSVVKSKGGRSPLRNLLRLVLHRLSTAASLPDGVGASEIFCLLPQVHALGSDAPEVVGGWGRKTLEEIHSRVEEHGTAYLFEVETLLVLRCFSQLFSTTDFRHAVVTPSLVLMAQCLSLTSFETSELYLRGLVMSCLIQEMTRPAGRICCEMLNFLSRLIRWSAGKVTAEHDIPADGSFTAIRFAEITTLHGNESDMILRIVHAALSNLQSIANSLKETNVRALHVVFGPIMNSVERLQTTAPENLRKLAGEVLADLLEVVSSNRLSQVALALYTKKAAIPKLLNPRFAEPGAAPKRKAEKLEIAKLKKKLRGEERSAARELQRDASFIHRQLLSEREAQDQHRQKKTNEVTAFLENQERTWKEQVKKQKRASGKW